MLWVNGKKVLAAMRTAEPKNGRKILFADQIQKLTLLNNGSIHRTGKELVSEGYLTKKGFANTNLRSGFCLTKKGAEVDLNTLQKATAEKKTPRRAANSIRVRFWRFFRMHKMCSLQEAFGTILEPGQSIKGASTRLTEYLNILKERGIVAVRGGDEDKPQSEKRWILLKYSDEPPEAEQ